SEEHTSELQSPCNIVCRLLLEKKTEVEIARRLIADQALHRRIVDVDDSDSYVARPHSPCELRDVLMGRSLIAAHRRGTTIWLETSGTAGPAAPGGPELGIHLGMSGRIVVTGPDGSLTFFCNDPPSTEIYTLSLHDALPI